MATVVIKITDTPGENGVFTLIEGSPDIPLDANGDPDLDNMTNAQVIAVGAMMELANQFPGNIDFRTFLRGD